MRPAGHASLRLSQWLLGSFRFASAKQGWQVSSFGRCRDTRGAITLGHLGSAGYRLIYMSNRKWFIHRVVKITFDGLPLCQEAWQVHHKDGNPTNNHLDNLEYVTNSQNASYSYLTNQSRKSGAAKKSKPVMWRMVGSQSWTLCTSITSAAQQVAMSQTTVSRCCKRGSSSKGIEFQFQKVDMQICGEEWRPMCDPALGKEVPGKMVSSLGRITTRYGQLHHGHLNKHGYFSTSLWHGPMRRTEHVHRLVAFSFLGPPPTPEHTCVNHKDGNKSNNALENLEWTTPSENMYHYFANVAVRRKGTGCKPVWSRPYGWDGAWTWHPSITSCADQLGIHPTSISMCLQDTLKQAGGHEFKLAESGVEASFPGEQWREIGLDILLKDRALRKHSVG